jgi:hypothetical protein
VRRPLSFIALIALVLIGTGLTGTSPVLANDVIPVNARVCVGAGTLYVFNNPGGFHWSITGGGACNQREAFDPSNTEFGIPVHSLAASFSGSGRSDSLGLCSFSPVVQNLQLVVTITYYDGTTNTDFTEQQTWSAPATSFPVMTLFVSSPNLGAGAIFTRIFLSCNNDGPSPSAQFNWVEMF